VTTVGDAGIDVGNDVVGVDGSEGTECFGGAGMTTASEAEPIGLRVLI
jgi:hypothetical protein